MKIEKLKELANKAGSEEWEYRIIRGDTRVIVKGSFEKGPGYISLRNVVDEIDNKDYARFIAAANPSAIIDMLAHIDAQSARIAELEHERDAATLEYDYLNDQIQFHVAEHKKTFEKLLAANKYADSLNQLLENRDIELTRLEKELADVAGSNAARVKELERELAALREQEPVYWQFMSVNGDWLGIGESGKNQAVKEGCEVRPLFSQPVPAAPVAVPDDVTSGELYRIANQITGAKGSLPNEWQPWADDIEDSLRKLLSLNSGSK